MHPVFEHALCMASTKEAVAQNLNDWMGFVVDVEWTDGVPTPVFGRARVGKINGYSIEVFSNDHEPAHFHVRGNDCNLRIRMDNDAPMDEPVDRRVYGKVLIWLRGGGKSKVLAKWSAFHG
jgi:hypothetical protein